MGSVPGGDSDDQHTLQDKSLRVNSASHQPNPKWGILTAAVVSTTARGMGSVTSVAAGNCGERAK